MKNINIDFDKKISSSVMLTGKGVVSLKAQGATATTAILEAITNAIAARKHGTTAKVVVDIRDLEAEEDRCRLMVLDYGVGMDLEDLDNLKNYGSSSSGSSLNRFGTGFNTFVLKLTDARLPFGVFSTKKGVTSVMEGPFQFVDGKATVQLYKTKTSIVDLGVVPEDLIERYGVPTTVVYADADREVLAQVRGLGGKNKPANRTSDIRRAIAEHISVRYWPLLEDDGLTMPKAQIFVHGLKVTNREGKKVEWTKPIRGLDIHKLAPLDDGKKDAWNLRIGSKLVRCSFYSGLLNEDAMATGFMGIEPLDIYFQGNTETSGYMVIQDGLVTAVPVFSTIFDKAEHPEYNKCAGYLMVNGAPEGAMNMTVDKNGICKDEAWEKVFSHIRNKKALHPTRSSRRTKVVDLQTSLVSYFDRANDVLSCNISCRSNVAVGSIRVPVLLDDKDKGRKSVYIFAAPHRKSNGRGFWPCLLDDYMDVLKYGSYLDYKGEKVDEVVLVGASFNRGTTEEFEAAFEKELEVRGLKKKLRYMTHREFYETFG